MDSCTKQKRAALMEWREYHAPSRSRQGGSHAQYSQGAATPAYETFATAAATTTQSPTTRSASALPTREPSTFGHSSFLARLCRCVHASDLLPLLCFAARSGFDHGQPHCPESAAHTWYLGARSRFQLPSLLLETTLVAVASGLSSGRLADWPLCCFGVNSTGGRRHRRRASRQEGLRQGPASRRRALVPVLYCLPLRPQVGGAGDLGQVSVCLSPLGAAHLSSALSQPEQRQKEARPPQNPSSVDAADAQGRTALVPRPPFRLCRRWRLRYSRVGTHRGEATPALDLGQSLLCQRQLVQTADSGSQQKGGGAATRERRQAACSRTGSEQNERAAKTQRGLVWRWTTRRGSRHWCSAM